MFYPWKASPLSVSVKLCKRNYSLNECDSTISVPPRALIIVLFSPSESLSSQGESGATLMWQVARLIIEMILKSIFFIAKHCVNKIKKP